MKRNGMNPKTTIETSADKAAAMLKPGSDISFAECEYLASLADCGSGKTIKAIVTAYRAGYARGCQGSDGGGDVGNQVSSKALAEIFSLSPGAMLALAEALKAEAAKKRETAWKEESAWQS